MTIMSRRLTAGTGTGAGATAGGSAPSRTDVAFRPAAQNESLVPLL